MPKIIEPLSPAAINGKRKPGRYMVGHVPGLALQVAQGGTRSWILRVVVGDVRRDIGLGAYPITQLADACKKALAVREKIAAGIDPVAEKARAKSQLIAAKAAHITFDECATKFIEAHESGWRNTKHAMQWRNTLDTYASPIIGKIAVADVDLEHVLQVIEPIWKTKTSTAARLRGRIEQVLDWAAVRRFRSKENPARWRGNLDKLLPAKTKIAKIEHYKALEIDAVAGFMAQLRGIEGISARALEFLVLTAARTKEVTGAKWGEIKDGVWTVPGSRMKAGVEHRVPLSKQALALLKTMPKIDGVDYVFPSSKGKEISNMAMLQLIRRMEVEAVPHGFRSTFRDWAGDRTSHTREVIEQALAHKLPDRVEAAYRRSDALEKRSHLMQDWANFCEAEKTPAKVLPMKRKRA
jgi:integrase